MNANTKQRIAVNPSHHVNRGNKYNFANNRSSETKPYQNPSIRLPPQAFRIQYFRALLSLNFYLLEAQGVVSIGSGMDHLAAVEERIVTERIKKKLDEVNAAAQEQLASVQDHVNFTLQKAYFKCAYECFDRSRKQEISNCVENCSVPVLNANNFVESEMAKFQERMNRSLMVCQDRFENAKLQKIKKDRSH
ncbi:Protein FAM136A [Rhynchospora pubera]|uniref:Protein FAM136A n=1 Tax=Rhynchospora pubera TaxID=906938 RepID=A0AAV8HPE5_9POAL|nr:Protein FAM136A [Rhynchospora pubera]